MFISLIVIALFFAALFVSAVKRVPAGQVYSLYRQGKPARLLQPGVHVVLPLVERIANKINLSGQVLRFEEPMADDRDVSGTVYWQVLEPERADAVFGQVDQLILRGAHEALCTERDVAHADRRVLGSHMKQLLNQSLRERGMMVTRVELDAA
ncbi:regulator of protease activity HflC (stomatin/prohibitin superfamily) [Rhodanobacter sp. ANJX3]|jgi:regulator of protease activity HflC (stomatin/prohibitin superfamily)|uniref:SPFH domain-containing protein n=1 Tax=unclassified Rhodanobacter TaxID=2621553 RepID=UPI0015C87E7D|nr:MULTISPECIES: SPFH domain-containing protein [unclassified Rhodanobacter]MBB5359593.1 regulator of protease activity HflC (stomatin/prohibitin superfamily) [Rhodanobacter sp. ANJX3]NYE30707.1 regulator of protease activity HflC (stomatin/prohibitin superfamily) [Rhodanobacter sp. K2T2]